MHVAIHQSVDGEVEAGVQVRDHRRVEVNGQRQGVGSVADEHDGVRRPAADERHENDEDRFHLAHGVHRRLVTGLVSLLYVTGKVSKHDHTEQ